ncbi:MAG: hypothetical protein KIG88_11020 [Weeksellaceae bacterium]|nr:hypothetical protein [Weeksellaceae bacterium]
MNFIKILFLSLLLISYSCSSDDNGSNILTEETYDENQAPSHFITTVDQVTDSKAVIIWEAAIDPENDSVTYDIYLEGVKIATEIEQLSFTFENLEELKNYTGFIIARDTNGNETRSEFHFITFKYYLKFLKTYDYNLDKEGGEVSSIAITQEGDYLIAGIKSRYPFVVKINGNGDLIWNKNFHFSDPDFYQTLNRPVEVIASSTGALFTFQHYVVEIDQSGNKIWQSDLRDIYGENQYILLESLNFDNENNLVVVGNRMHSDLMDDTKAIAVKFSPQKNIIWAKSLEIDYYNEIIDFVVDDNNNLMMFGTTTLKHPVENYSKHKFWLFKLDENGNKIFEKKFGLGHCIPLKIIKTKDNNFILQGSWMGGYDVVTGLLVKTNGNGEFIWEKDIDSSLIYQFSIVELDNSDIIISGMDSINRPMGYSFVRYIKYTSNGELVWKKTGIFEYSYTAGVDLVGNNDGGFTMVSDFHKYSYNPFDHNFSNPKIMLFKLDPDGNYE